MDHDQVLSNLAKRLIEDQLVLFVGDLGVHTPAENTLPSRQTLAGFIAKELGFEEHVSFSELARHYSYPPRDRLQLVGFLKTQVSRSQIQLTEIHHGIFALNPAKMVYLGWDPLFHKKHDKLSGERSIDFIVTDDHLQFAREQNSCWIMLHGTFDNVDSLIITDDDIRDLKNRKKRIYETVKSWLAKNSVVFVGDFTEHEQEIRTLYTEAIADGSPKLRPPSYIIASNVPERFKNSWEDIGVICLDLELEYFIRELNETANAERVAQERLNKTQECSTRGPYLFLDYYQSDDASIFFGRDREIEQVTKLVKKNPITILYGESGVGKTSLLLAGLENRLLTDSLIIYVRCDEDPFEAIRRALLSTIAYNVSLLIEPADKVIDDIFLLVNNATRKSIVVFLDQFEEIFTKIGDTTRKHFLEMISQWAQKRHYVRFVISIREDKFCLIMDQDIRNTSPEIGKSYFMLKPFERTQAIEAITRPAEAYGISISPDLVNALIQDLDSRGIDPVQLAIVCDRLYRHMPMNSYVIDLGLYETLGRAQTIIDDYIDEAIEDFPAMERGNIRAILKAMATTEGYKASIEITDIARETGLSILVVTESLENLVTHRLLRKRQGVFPYEIAHDRMAEKIKTWFSPEEFDRKAVSEMLQRELKDHKSWNTFIAPEKIQVINKSANDLEISSEPLALILSSCLHYNIPLGNWPSKIKDERAMLPLIQHASGKKPEERLKIVRALGMIDLPLASKELERFLGEEEDAVVLEAILELCLQNPLAFDLDVIAARLSHPVEQIRMLALRCVSAQHQDAAVSHMKITANDPSITIRTTSIRLIARRKSSIAMEALVQLLLQSNRIEMSELIENAIIENMAQEDTRRFLLSSMQDHVTSDVLNARILSILLILPQGDLLTHFGLERLTSFLLNAVEVKDQSDISQRARALLKDLFQDPERRISMLPILVARLGQEGPKLQAMNLLLIEKDNQLVIDALIKVTENDRVTTHRVRALEILSSSSYVNALGGLLINVILTDTTPAMSRLALKTLALIGIQGAVEGKVQRVLETLVRQCDIDKQYYDLSERFMDLLLTAPDKKTLGETLDYRLRNLPTTDLRERALATFQSPASTATMSEMLSELIFAEPDSYVVYLALCYLDLVDDRTSDIFTNFLSLTSDERARNIAVSILIRRGQSCKIPESIRQMAISDPTPNMRLLMINALLTAPKTIEACLLFLDIAEQPSRITMKDFEREFAERYKELITKSPEPIIRHIIWHTTTPIELLNKYIAPTLTTNKAIDSIKKILIQERTRMASQRIHSSPPINWLALQETEYAFNALIEILLSTKPEDSLGWVICEAFREYAPPWLELRLLKLLMEETDLQKRTVLMNALGALGFAPEEIGNIRKMIFASNVSDKNRSLQRFLDQGGSHAFSVAHIMLESSEESLRHTSAQWFARCPTSKAVGVLEYAYQHEHSELVKETMINTLHAIGISEATTALTRLKSKEKKWALRGKIESLLRS